MRRSAPPSTLDDLANGFLLVVVLLLSQACGGSGGNTPCTRGSECAIAEMCMDGMCIARPDADRRDSGPDLDSGNADSGPAADAGPPVGAGCSPDLQTILAFDGSELARCAPDLGCFEGRCVDPCDAAASSGGTLSCEFLAPTPSMWAPIVAPCFAVFVANSWPRDVTVTVRRGAETYDVTMFGRIPVDGVAPELWPAVPATGIPADGVAVLFLSSNPDAVGTRGDDLTCPITPAINAGTELLSPGIGDGFRIETDAPVAAYDILPFGGSRSFTPSAQLLLPTSVWSDEYLVFAPPAGTFTDPALWVRVVADEDDTTIRVRPTVDLQGGPALASIPEGMTGTVTLNAGEYAFWQTGAADPTGTIVQADRPVAVFSGNRLLRLQPTAHPGGDSEHQQSLPFEALASEYVGSPFATRRSDGAEETIVYRLLGAIDGTTLTYDPPIAGAPSSIDQSEVVTFEVAGPFRVTSQDDRHPFAFGQLMRSAYHFIDAGVAPRDGITQNAFDDALGDEEFVIQFPPAQFLSRYVFFTDPTYGTTNLSLTRVAVDGVFADVRVDCLGVVDGWTPVGTDGRFEVATIDSRRAGVGVGTCEPGGHTADSDQPFGVVVWGIDLYASYGYPAGGNAQSLAELPPLI